MQAGTDARCPKVAVEKRLKIFLEDRLDIVTPPGSLKIVAEPGSESSVLESLRTLNRDRDRSWPQPHVVLAIGPEGGWMPREVEMLERHGFNRASMGNRILRTDAAVLILLGLVHEWHRVLSRANTA